MSDAPERIWVTGDGTNGSWTLTESRMKAHMPEGWQVPYIRADRIEELKKERDTYFAERNKFQLYLQRTHADWEIEVAAVDGLNAKLAQAVKLIELAVELAQWNLNPKLRDDMVDFTTTVKGESHV